MCITIILHKYKEENNCKFWEAIVQQEAKDSLVDEKTVIDKMTKMFKEKQAEALSDCKNTSSAYRKLMKVAPGATKGLAFVCASIAGYQAGLSASDMILGKKA